MDYLETGNAIAARFVGITAPSYSFEDDAGDTVTVQDDALTTVSATLPNQIATTPALFVMPPEDREFEWGPSLLMHVRQFYTIRLFRDQTQDIARRMAALQAWRTPLALRIAGQIQLGLSYVDWAELRSGRIGEVEYAEVKYDVVDLLVEVKVREPIAAQA